MPFEPFEPFETSRGTSLVDLIQSGVLDTDAEEAFHRVAWLVCEVFKAPVTLITLNNGERFWLKSHLAMDEAEVVEGLAPFHSACVGRDVFEINDALVDSEFFDAPIVTGGAGMRFYAGAPIVDAAGFPCGTVGIADRAPRKLSQGERTMLRCFADQVESELKILLLMQEEANLRLEVSKAFNAKSTFMSLMSHEIRTPIAGIIGAADILISEQKSENQLLKTIWTSGADLLQLLNETLDSAKIEAGGLNIRTEPVDLQRLREKLDRHFEPMATNKGLEFSVEFHAASDLPELVYSDPTRLRQILFNITHNAMKFTHEGKVSCRIELAGVDAERTDACELRIIVSDTGIGMTQEALESLFVPFRQGDEGEDRAYGGTGLGMSLVKQLCDRMGGRVEVNSRHGHGSVISLFLPVMAVQDAWVPSGQVSDNLIEPSRLDQISPRDLRGMQILVADDNPQNRMILQRVLTSWGCETVLAEDGEEAFEMARNASFDAIILDLHMPRRSGFEVAQALRQYTSSTRLIACSADTTQAAFARCQDCGFDSMVEKPFDWARMYEALAVTKS